MTNALTIWRCSFICFICSLSFTLIPGGALMASASESPDSEKVDSLWGGDGSGRADFWGFVDKQQGSDKKPVTGSAEAIQDKGNVPTYRERDVRVCMVDLNYISLMCERLKSRCDSQEDGRLVEIYRKRTDTPSAEWQPTGEHVCRYPADPVDEGDPFPGFTLEDFRSLGIVTSEVLLQPSPHTLRGAHTNMIATAKIQHFTVDVAGFSVDVTATPVAYSWNYGDGTSSGRTSDPGMALDQDRWGQSTPTSHVYEETGDFAVTLTTYFTGMYSVDGGPWTPIPGEAAVESAPVTISVWRSETNNYADNCFENPQGAGCQGAGG